MPCCVQISNNVSDMCHEDLTPRRSASSHCDLWFEKEESKSRANVNWLPNSFQSAGEIPDSTRRSAHGASSSKHGMCI